MYVVNLSDTHRRVPGEREKRWEERRRYEGKRERDGDGDGDRRGRVGRMERGKEGEGREMVGGRGEEVGWLEEREDERESREKRERCLINDVFSIQYSDTSDKMK